MARDSNGLGLLVAFTLGGLVGAGIALLYAPQSGEKTRRKILDAVEEAKEEITEYAERVKSRLG
jgi:gas vesicle protein